MSTRGGRLPPDRTGGGGRRDDAPAEDEKGLGPDFDLHLGLDLGLDSASGPARRLSSARIASMVSAVVDEATAAAPEPLSPAFAPPLSSPFDVTRTVVFEPPSSAPRRIARRGAVLTAALLAASVGSASAAIWVVVRERSPAEVSPAAVSPAAIAPERGRPVRTRLPAAAEVVPDPSPEPAQEEAEEPALDEPALDEPALDDSIDDAGEADRAPTRRKRMRESSRRQRSQRQSARQKQAVEDAEAAREAAERAQSSRSDPVVLPPDAPVEDIVALANQRRKEKRWRAAEELYERARRDHAGTDAATIATVASASLHLDHLADPAGALVRFRRALRLRPDGPLAEEARWGLAETHRALGDDAAERAALRSFLSAHPVSVNAARARQRLAELGAGP
jgi:tetratricopeptide (TPR) repeat protein